MMLGNLSTNEMAARLGIDIAIGDESLIESWRQENVSIPLAPGKWHCFDLPFVLLCADMQTAQNLYDILSRYPIKNNATLTISLQETRE